jgi:hypothetical protein
MKCNKSISIFLLFVIGLVAGFLVNSYVPQLVGGGTQTYLDDNILETELSFEYPTGWHVFGTRNFEDSNMNIPNIELKLSSDPITFTYPSGGGFNTAVQVSTIELGTAIHASSENASDWQTVTSDKVLVNGKEAARIRVVTDMTHEDISYEIPFVEQVFVFGEKFGYQLDHYYSDAEDENEKAWKLLLDTFEIE